MLADFISLFFPQYCVACNSSLVKGERLVCITCQHKLPKTNSHLDNTNFVAQKFYGKVRIIHAFAFYRFERRGRVQKILHELKYKNQPELGVLLGQLYGQELKEAGLANKFDIIIPVPLHKSKLRRRGYNQSQKFAEGLASSMEIDVIPNCLKRSRRTETQTRKSRLERWNNVAEIFELNNQDKIRDKKILLVDDVITTGATLEACALELLNGGAKEISVCAIAAAK